MSGHGGSTMIVLAVGDVGADGRRAQMMMLRGDGCSSLAHYVVDSMNVFVAF